MLSKIDIISGELNEAACDPRGWSTALNSINDFVGGSGAVLLSVDERLRHAPTSSDLAEMMDDYFCNGWHSNDRREGCRPLLLKRGLAIDYEFQDADAIENCDYYADFLLKHGRKWFAGLGANLEGNLWCIALQRSPSRGPFVAADLPRLRAVQAQLIASARVANAVSKSWMVGAFDTFDLIDCAALILDQKGRVIEINEAARRIVGSYVSRHPARLRIPNESFITALETVNGDSLQGARPRSTDKVVTKIDGKSYLLEATRLYNQPAHIFSRASLLIRITSCRTDVTTALRTIYRLTAAETRVALALASGYSVNEIGASLRVTANTVRVQLKAVYAKTGTGTQSKLVAFVAALDKPYVRGQPIG